MSANKTQPTSQSVEEFIAGIEDTKRQADGRKLLKLMQDITKEEPTMWGPSIIGFGTRHYKYATGREGDMPIVGFSPRKSALTLYSVVYYDQNLELAEKLGSHAIGKGCLYIKDLDKVDLTVLAKMIRIACEQKDQRDHS